MKLYRSKVAAHATFRRIQEVGELPTWLMLTLYALEDTILQTIRMSQGKHLLGRHILGAL